MAELAMCSKVLYEKEVLSMRKEIEALKLDKFWWIYGLKRLYEGMSILNEQILCGCESCSENRNTHQFHFVYDTHICKWQPAFEAKLCEYKFKFLSVPLFQMGSPEKVPENDWCDNPFPFCDIDADFVYASEFNDWENVKIGKRLWSCENVDNLKLQEYKKFIHEITLHSRTERNGV